MVSNLLSRSAIFVSCSITLVCCMALVSLSCTPQSPVINSINPKIGGMGEALMVQGKHFGDSREESYITIAGASPTSSSYRVWQDDQIVVTVPEFGEAGLVYVHVKGRKSNGALFSNRTAMPMAPQSGGIQLEPRILAVEPQTGSIGSMITITGNNFGNSRERGGVFFSWTAELSAAPAEVKTPAFVEVSETEFGYELWNEREIRVRIPDGAISGNMEVRTPRGNSAPFFFDISGRPGTKTFRDKRSYTISYSVSIKTGQAESPNILYLWVPQPTLSPAQRNIELLSRNTEPFVDNYRGVSLFKLNDLAANSETRINLSYKVEVYAQEISMRPQSVRQETSPIGDIYTQSAPLIPAGDIRIKSQVNALLGRERNPYIKAQRIYEWMTGENMIRETSSANSAIEALEAKQADPYTAALLYCAMLRAAAVPCIPVAGVLINRNRQTLRHWWVEFWIDGAGWIPADPAMGAGAVPPVFSSRSDRASFYFGNLDNQRIAFSRGLTSLSQMAPQGRPVFHSRSYALQNLWEEAIGGIESYSSLWGDVTITGIYVQ
jgi:hypothetical protein